MLTRLSLNKDTLEHNVNQVWAREEQKVYEKVMTQIEKMDIDDRH